MKKINNLNVRALKEKLYVAFMMFVVRAIDGNETVKAWFAFFVNKFKAAYERLDAAYLQYDLDACTKAVQEANNVRDRAFREMRDMIDMLITYPKSEAKTLAAEALKRVIEKYGGNQILKLGFTAKTAAYSNLVEDFETKFQTEVATAAIGQYLQALKEAQQVFDEKYMIRSVCESKQVKGEMADARTNMDEYYRLFVDAVNVKAYEDTEGQLDDFIDLMNVEIGKNRTYTGQGQVGSTGSSSGTDEDGVRIKYITFEFANGNSQRIRLEVGAPIEAQQNTPGYKWDKEIPEFMPNRNIVFREVPIEERMATATFHFFDHSEEQLRQVVGSVLNAPANTDGYYWDPTVPATMPAQDTQYYELPIEDNDNGNYPPGYDPDADDDPGV